MSSCSGDGRLDLVRSESRFSIPRCFKGSGVPPVLANHAIGRIRLGSDLKWADAILFRRLKEPVQTCFLNARKVGAKETYSRVPRTRDE